MRCRTCFACQREGPWPRLSGRHRLCLPRSTRTDIRLIVPSSAPPPRLPLFVFGIARQSLQAAGPESLATLRPLDRLARSLRRERHHHRTPGFRPLHEPGSRRPWLLADTAEAIADLILAVDLGETKWPSEFIGASVTASAAVLEIAAHMAMAARIVRSKKAALSIAVFIS